MTEKTRLHRTAVIKLGGSGGITETGLDLEYIDALWAALAPALLGFDRLIFVIGGGRPARAIQEQVKKEFLEEKGFSTLDELSDDQLLDLNALQHQAGIEVTRNHAAALQLKIKSLLTAEEHQMVGNHKVAETIPTSPSEAKKMVNGEVERDEEATIFVSGGIEINQSTDAVAIQFLELQLEWYEEQKKLGRIDHCSIHLAILSSIARTPNTEEDISSMLYTSDPNRNKDAEPILSASVEGLVQAGVLSEESDDLHHSPGSKTPLDRRAVKLLVRFFKQERALWEEKINVLAAKTKILFTGSKNFDAISQYLNDESEDSVSFIPNSTILHGDATAPIMYA